jgi:hypothetical protein
MPRRAAIIQGYPDPGGKRLCHALADASSEDAGRGLYKRCVSVETPSILFRPNKIGYTTPFGWPLSTYARWLAIP